MNQKECSRLISEDLIRLGVCPGGVLLVHSSFKSLGPVPGGIQTVVEGLLEALGPEGTLLMPALSYESVSAEHPVFDARTTPCCVGAIPEYFRTMPGTLRSLHPTHSVSGQGRQAAELLAGHELDSTPVGSHSPFSRLKEAGGQVLMLGCGLLCNTTIHGVEEAAGAPYIFEEQPVDYTLVDFDGRRFTATHRRHSHFPQHYDRVRPGLLGRGLSEGKVLEALCHLYNAQALWDCALSMLNQDVYCFYKD